MRRWLVFSALLLTASRAWGAESLPKELEGVKVSEHLGQHVNLGLQFTDHLGRKVALRKYFGDGKPVLLTLNYYRCPMLCSLQLNAVVQALKKLDWTAGKNFRIVTVSIDPKETPKLARDKRANLLGALGRGEIDWTFHVGTERNIKALARSVGFSYAYVPKQKQYAHPAVLFFLSPEGKIARYLYGIKYSARNLKFALIEASEGKVGSTFEKILLSCFQYDPNSGSYSAFAWGIMRLGGGVTLAFVLVLLGLLWRRERRQRKAKTAKKVGG